MFEKKSEDSRETTIPVDTKAVKKTKATTKEKDVVTLASICAELKIDTTEARVKLRAAGKRLRHTPGQPWEWAKGSPVIKEVKAILKGEEKD